MSKSIRTTVGTMNFLGRVTKMHFFGENPIGIICINILSTFHSPFRLWCWLRMILRKYPIYVATRRDTKTRLVKVKFKLKFLKNKNFYLFWVTLILMSSMGAYSETACQQL